MRLGSLVKNGDVLCLSGDLGSGKTTFMQGFAQGWGSVDSVSSPTFVIVNQYRRPDGGLLHHLDAYRIESIDEAIDLDIDAMLSSGILAIEWAERIARALPTDCLKIHFTWVGDEQRDLVFSPFGARYIELMNQFRQITFGG
jgi:tRNA threonylcarbamoyladenosine biosynthesis protein TsaE